MNTNIQNPFNITMPPANTEIVYIFYFDAPLGNDNHRAQTYVGTCQDFYSRKYEHDCGRGAKITAAAVEKGIKLHLVFWMHGGRKEERAIKNKKNCKRFLAQQGIIL